jgi:hypothetical protein
MLEPDRHLGRDPERLSDTEEGRRRTKLEGAAIDANGDKPQRIATQNEPEYYIDVSKACEYTP